ncbi:AAC(3) family N-acetyltransferase [Chryseobacterium vrystaatense]|uniref:Aminoglycoside N(3)-acetyltransferase n=1 Tax=Chryseobacterium vrystaatense TaxID=307480 RepID=A0A1M5MQU8_9FLAO|nr:AAC(3) family N-acetyltransferase [Chryseobacterium vrystaatense]SHG79681.1 aminoglycoside 3-N-acetyltransferase [Chryseobacterium vrystaatense]
MKKKIYDLLRTKLKVRSLTHLRNKYKRKSDRMFYRKKFTSRDFIEKFTSMGVKKGDVIFIHSSWDEFYNYDGTPESFIDLILNMIGEEGTLLMPSYPLIRKKGGTFSIKTTPTLAGLLPEVFRNYKKVERSLDYHSVAAYGKLAKYITESHIYSESSWDENSPYYKLAEVKAKVFSLGLGKHHVGTVMHCADSILRRDYEYFDLFFKKHEQITIKKQNGEIILKDYLTKEDDFYYAFTESSHWSVVKKYFDKNKYKIDKLSNLHITMFDADYVVHKAIELGKKGIVVYTQPDAKKYTFSK